MENIEIMSYVDHTLLNPTCKREDIDKLIEEYFKYGAKSVCIPPSYVSYVNDNYNNINITTVIGFPLGYQETKVKVYEAKKAINDGANEIDMVINITDLKNKNYDKILKEINLIKKEIKDKTLKVIIETCYLSNEEKIKMCEIMSDSDADYIKTSTGFGSEGATVSDIKLFRDNLSKDKKIKAAGGIKTKEDMIEYINLGCDRLGTSSAIKILFHK